MLIQNIALPISSPAAGLANEGDGIALFDSRPLQSAIFNSENFSYIATDARGVIQIFNVGAERLLGYAAVDVINKITPADISDAQELTARTEQLSAEFGLPIAPGFAALSYKAARCREDIYALTYIRQDGSRLSAEVSVTALRNHLREIIGYLLVVTDNTVRQSASETLRARDSALRMISQGLIISTPDGRIISVNDAFSTITGYEKADILGRTCCFLQGALTDPHTVEAIRLAKKKTIEFSGTILNYHKDGRQFWNELTITPVFGERGAQSNLTHFVCIMRDVTQRKSAELVFDHYHLHLEEVVLARTAELEKAKDVAEASCVAQGQFLANMSHEIRTPINAVMGFAYLCLGLDLPPREREYLSKIQSASESLLGIVNDILDFSKLDAGKLILESIPFSLDDLLFNVSSLFSLQARKKNIELVISALPSALFCHDCASKIGGKNCLPTTLAQHTSFSGGSLPVPAHNYLLGDPLRLSQVLINLVGNALKFTAAGTIHLNVDSVSINSDTVLLRFKLHDTGIGMTPEQQGTMFNAFTQADNSTTRQYGGTGLGLAISQQLIAAMGGKISVNSKIGGGSCFSFDARFGIAAGVVVLPQALPQLSGKKVLVVDNNSVMRTLLSMHAKSFDCEVETVACGQAALAYARAGRHFDIILMDWLMPDLDGLATARGLRAAGNTAPIILITGGDLELARCQAKDGDIQIFLSKPVACTALYDNMCAAFGGLDVLPLPTFKQSLAPQLSGRRILLVDDNDFNREVGRELVEMTGATVDTVNDGLQATQAVISGGYDLVLMDIQMPVMDGYTATRAIRQRWPDLPIIALTAHAMHDERRHVLDAGMNEILTKPILPKLLYAVLASYLAPNALAEIAPPEPSAPPVAAPLAVLPPVVSGLPAPVLVFDLVSALTRVNDDPKLLERFLRLFRERNARCVSEIGSALDTEDWASARRIAHALKGGAGTIGLLELAAAAARLEAVLAQTLLGKGPAAQRNANFAALEIAWTRAQEALTTLLDSSNK